MGMTERPIVLQGTGVRKYFPVHTGFGKPKKYVKAVDGVDITIHEGEIYGLVGETGCGKSTLLRCLNGLEEIQEGEVLLDDQVVNPNKKNLSKNREKIGMVFQSYDLFPHLTILQNVTLAPIKVKKRNRREVEKEALELLERVGLRSKKDDYPRQLSGGQKQRVALARSIIRHPKAFLMDEPLSNLDAKLRNSTRIEIVKLQRSLKVTTIYVTHDQTEAMTMADRMVVMKEGVVQQVGTPREIYGLPVNMFVAGFIGSPQINFIRGKLEGETFVCGENRLRLAPWAAHKLEAWSSKEVILGLHPEVFSLAEEAGDGTFKADFVAKEFMGSHLIIHAQIQQQDVQCRIDDTSACFGGRLYLKPDMSRAHFFDAETGEAILHMEAGDDHA